MRKLDHTELRQFCDPGQFDFTTTRDLDPHHDMIGQDTAARALEFGLAVKKKGYNIYISGAAGTGRTTFAKAYAEAQAAKEPVAFDLCYVYNFENPKSPVLLKLPAGTGKKFRDDMTELMNRLAAELPRVFAEKDFEDKRSEVMRELTGKRDVIIRAMAAEAKEQNFGIKSTGTGMYFMPIVDGEMITEEQFDELTQDQKDDIATNSEQIQLRAAESMRVIRDYEREARTRTDEIEYSTGLFAVGYHMAPVIEQYSGDEKTFKYLNAVKEDILDNIDDFLPPEEDDAEQLAQMLPWNTKRGPEDVLAKYKVNLLVDNSHLTSAPVVIDFRPTYPNLVGEIEYDNEYGNLTTDFMKIKPGLLHKANGGYLILQAQDVLSNPNVWESLRQALLTGEIITEPSR
ncbi:MAG: AAA family ATPase, partial [Defluviitaleaceae bacterium]|nr:AAA family ATPase [Defluviitaleaceae bacterium]